MHNLDEQHPPHGVVAVIPRVSQLLVIRRSLTVRAPGAYCFPGGGIQPGEDEPAALVRELREELSVAIRPVRRLWTSVTPWSVALAWWLAEFVDGAEPHPNPDEVDACYWLNPTEIRQLPGVLESNLHFLDAWERGEFHW